MYYLAHQYDLTVLLLHAWKYSHRYSPIVVLLRHFDIFQDLAHEASPHEQLGVNSEIAAVIKKFTEPVIEDEDDHSGGRLDCHSVRWCIFVCYCYLCFFLLNSKNSCL